MFFYFFDWNLFAGDELLIQISLLNSSILTASMAGVALAFIWTCRSVMLVYFDKFFRISHVCIDFQSKSRMLFIIGNAQHLKCIFSSLHAYLYAYVYVSSKNDSKHYLKLQNWVCKKRDFSVFEVSEFLDCEKFIGVNRPVDFLRSIDSEKWYNNLRLFSFSNFQFSAHGLGSTKPTRFT